MVTKGDYGTLFFFSAFSNFLCGEGFGVLTMSKKKPTPRKESPNYSKMQMIYIYIFFELRFSFRKIGCGLHIRGLLENWVLNCNIEFHLLM